MRMTIPPLKTNGALKDWALQVPERGSTSQHATKDHRIIAGRLLRSACGEPSPRFHRSARVHSINRGNYWSGKTQKRCATLHPHGLEPLSNHFAVTNHHSHQCFRTRSAASALSKPQLHTLRPPSMVKPQLKTLPPSHEAESKSPPSRLSSHFSECSQSPSRKSFSLQQDSLCNSLCHKSPPLVTPELFNTLPETPKTNEKQRPVVLRLSPIPPMKYMPQPPTLVPLTAPLKSFSVSSEPFKTLSEWNHHVLSTYHHNVWAPCVGSGAYPRAEDEEETR